MQGPSIGSMLDQQKGFGPGFDFLRIALAISVVAAHTPYVATGGSAPEQMWIVWFPQYAILVMFFALSGFLIAASGLRLSLKEFLVNRGMRIVPALAVEIVLSALILGPIFAALPLSDYFASAGTYKYFTNVVGLVNYVLPGVFAGNPAPGSALRSRSRGTRRNPRNCPPASPARCTTRSSARRASSDAARNCRSPSCSASRSTSIATAFPMTGAFSPPAARSAR
ncbi:acyltransferase family protein [Bradyrhizobium sp. ISRA463]|nr:acyltransferase family protein [Bradyrhizobium sp. ISRA463]WGS22326.1 acyltransferase family protein [Bradyrhizobium sp. ISRA463]